VLPDARRWATQAPSCALQTAISREDLPPPGRALDGFMAAQIPIKNDEAPTARARHGFSDKRREVRTFTTSRGSLTLRWGPIARAVREKDARGQLDRASGRGPVTAADCWPCTPGTIHRAVPAAERQRRVQYPSRRGLAGTGLRAAPQPHVGRGYAESRAAGWRGSDTARRSRRFAG